MAAPRTTTPVVVFTTSTDPLLHGPLAVVRSLGRWGVPTYVVHPGGRLPVDSSRHLSGWFAMDAVDGDPGRTVARLVAVAQELGARPVLVPMDDQAALIVDGHESDLAEHFLFPLRPDGLAELLASKRGLSRACEALGVPAPSACFPASREEAAACAGRLPVVVKAVDPVLLRRAPGARSVTVARHRNEVLTAYDLLAAGGPGNVMVQEYIPGDASTIWMFNGYFDRSSHCRFGGVGVKLRQCPPGTGPTSLGETRSRDAVRATAERFLGALGYTGIVDLGFRYDARDCTMKLLDVNPRIGGTFRLFVGREGIDVVRALYLDLTGQPVPDDRVAPGRRWQDEPHDLLAQAVHRRRGESSWPAWLRSLRGVDERAWYAPDDLGPCLLAYRHAAARRRGAAALVNGTPRSGGVSAPRRPATAVERSAR